MNESRLILKQSNGWFAAGREMNEALTILSDGATKLYSYLCLNAGRPTAQFRFRPTCKHADFNPVQRPLARRPAGQSRFKNDSSSIIRGPSARVTVSQRMSKSISA